MYDSVIRCTVSLHIWNGSKIYIDNIIKCLGRFKYKSVILSWPLQLHAKSSIHSKQKQQYSKKEI